MGTLEPVCVGVVEEKSTHELCSVVNASLLLEGYSGHEEACWTPVLGSAEKQFWELIWFIM